jgi:curli biogenesis system outer membrane secretion channel CsgG
MGEEAPKRSCNDFAAARTLFAEKPIAARALPISSESCPHRRKPQYWMYNRDGRVTKMEILGNPQAYKDTVRRLFITCFVFCALVANLSGQQKKRIAVMNFDYATVQSYVQSLFGSNQDIGLGIADLLVDKLVSDGAYSVIERKALDKILAEQNFSNSDRADPASAAKIGRVLGVDAILVGSITQFGRDDKTTDVGGLGSVTGRFGIGGVSRKKSTAVVGITARLVNTSTAEILASVSQKGESTRSGTGLLGAGGGWSSMAAGALDMKSSNFANTILGEATSKAVTAVAAQLDAKATALPTQTISISGMVADAAPDGTVVINVGSRAGLKVGDRLQVARKVRDIKDPATGRVLRSVEDSVGTLVITQVDEQSAAGKFTGSSPAKVGDTVRNAQ